MPYANASHRKLPYHLDGTRVGWNQGTNSVPFDHGIKYWMDDAKKTASNNTDGSSNIYQSATYAKINVWWIFPRKVFLKQAVFMLSANIDNNGNKAYSSFQGSPDTTDGVDGTWYNVTVVAGTPNGNYTDAHWFRKYGDIAFKDAGGVEIAVKAIRLHWSETYYMSFRHGHLYGYEETRNPDELIVLQDDALTEFATPLDFGQIMESSTHNKVVYIKNKSTTKTANNVALSFALKDNANFTMSIDDGVTFASTYTLTSLAAGATQKVIIKNQPGPVPQVLGPRHAELKSVVGSWT